MHVARSTPGLGLGPARARGRAPLCVLAKKGRGGPAKNEGVYFTYEPAETRQEPAQRGDADSKEFSWVASARSSVHKLRAPKRPPPPQQHRSRTPGPGPQPSAAAQPSPPEARAPEPQEPQPETASNPPAAVRERKARMLARLRGEPATDPGSGGSNNNAGDSSEEVAIAAALAAAASDEAAAPHSSAMGDAQLLELINLAQELAGSAFGSDPLGDPLAGLLPEERAAGALSSSSSSSSSRSRSSSSSGAASSSDGSSCASPGLADLLGADGEGLLAAVAEAQAALDSDAAGEAPQLVSTAELLAWEAAQAAGSRELDVEAELAAAAAGGVYEDPADAAAGAAAAAAAAAAGEPPGEDDWCSDPQLVRWARAGDASFAQLLERAVEDDAPDASSGGGGGSGSGGGQPAGVAPEPWAGLALADWVEAAAAEAPDGAAGEDGEEVDGGLAGLLAALDADASLDAAARARARLAVQGAFNAEPGGGRRGSSGGASSGGSSVEGPASRGPTTTGAAASEQTLLPRPPWTSQ